MALRQAGANALIASGNVSDAVKASYCSPLPSEAYACADRSVCSFRS